MLIFIGSGQTSNKCFYEKYCNAMLQVYRRLLSDMLIASPKPSQRRENDLKEFQKGKKREGT